MQAPHSTFPLPLASSTSMTPTGAERPAAPDVPMPLATGADLVPRPLAMRRALAASVEAPVSSGPFSMKSTRVSMNADGSRSAAPWVRAQGHARHRHAPHRCTKQQALGPQS